MNHAETFQAIYEQKVWGEDVSDSYPGQSGNGSSLEFNKEYIDFLQHFIRLYGVQSVVDVGCGDWRCGVSIYKNLPLVKYTGYDCYSDVVDSHVKNYKPLSPLWNFETKNCLLEANSMVEADLLIVKDVLQHWLDSEVVQFLDTVVMSKKYKYILSINCDCHENSSNSLGKVGDFRRLGASHTLLKKYEFISIFKYKTKSVCLLTCTTDMSYSQVNQDTNIVNFYNGLRDGYFVDIGATNGISFSNSYLLESIYGWKGICVEPNPTKFRELVSNRTSNLCDRAVFNTTDKDVEFIVAYNEDLSGITVCLDKYKDQIDKKGKKVIMVKTITITDLLDLYSAPSFIHYLSLDTEGSELEILRCLNFDRYAFGRIDVEHNFVEPRRSLIRQLLSTHGYVFMHANQQDDCYKLHR